MLNPLIIARDIHFASSMIVAGVVFFDLFVASPVLQPDSAFPVSEHAFRKAIGNVLWTSLALSVVSALAWLCLLSMRITGKAFDQVVTDGTIWTVLSRTQFGLAWEMRLLLAALLAAWLALPGNTKGGWRAKGLGIVASILAGAYLGLLAFSGHGAQGLENARMVHLAADALHLIAASLWVGGLVPFVLLLALLQSRQEPGWTAAAAVAGNRFSTLGVLAVGILLVSGTINASFLLAGMHSLIDTSYGQLLLFKVVLVAAMLCLAGINRQHLLPRLRIDAPVEESQRTVRQLVRNSLAETAFGLAIILIVGVLGIMAPASEMAAHVH